MKILFVWTGVTSYMADCWRALAAGPDVELKVWIDVSGANAKAVAFDAEHVMRGLDYVLTDDAEGFGGLERLTTEWVPDIVFAVGWHSAICRAVVEDPRLKDVPKVCCFDMPWRWQLRCLVAPLVLGRFLRNYQAAFVPGSVCARYARWLGFRKIHQGLFSIDTGRFEEKAKGEGQRAKGYFLYIGRNSREKRLDDLREAHRRYRARGGALELRMYGKGLEGGFVNPEDVPGLMRNAAAFVLASDFDPWPLVLLEAMSAGCPVIASDKCTNRPELGKNWQVFKVGDVEALAREMMMAEKRRSGEVSGKVGIADEVVKEYDCKAWVKRVRGIVGSLEV